MTDEDAAKRKRKIGTKIASDVYSESDVYRLLGVEKPASELAGVEVPFEYDDQGRIFLTGLQLIQNPDLAAFVQHYAHCFKLVADRDIYIFAPPKEVTDG